MVFDPYMSSRPLAEALVKAPAGQLIEDDAYYAFSSVFFYANRTGLLLDGRKMNLEYGSNAPGAPNVFLPDADFADVWHRRERFYLLVERWPLARIQKLVSPADLHTVSESGGKFLMTNHAYSN